MMTHATWMMAVLVVLATWRLTVLVTNDLITQPFRTWLGRNFWGWLVDMVNCPWCVSPYLGAGLTTLYIYYPDTMQWVCLVLAASVVSGALADKWLS